MIVHLIVVVATNVIDNCNGDCDGNGGSDVNDDDDDSAFCNGGGGGSSGGVRVISNTRAGKGT